MNELLSQQRKLRYTEKDPRQYAYAPSVFRGQMSQIVAEGRTFPTDISETESSTPIETVPDPQTLPLPLTAPLCTMDASTWVQAQFEQQNITQVYTGIALAASVAIIQLYRWNEHRKFEQAFGKATYRPKFHPQSPLGAIFGGGLAIPWQGRFTLYKKSKRELITLEPTIWGGPILYTNSIEVTRQFAGVTPWYKPTWSSLASLYWGNNILAENDAGWKKHRRIVQPAFNHKTYEMVWNETRRLYNEMLVTDEWPSVSGASKILPHTQTTTQRVALYVIVSCGFGFPLGWKENTYAGDQEVNLGDSIKFQSDNLMLVCFAPKWLFTLPFKKLRYIAKSTNTLRAWFNQNIVSRKAEIRDTLTATNGDEDALKKDVFTRITLASQMDGRFHLKDSEIIGNIWAMLFAGHETTAGTLAATLCFLASHKEEQDIVFEEIQKLAKESAEEQFNFDQYESFLKTRSAFIEALRMFPAGYMVIRETREDTVLHVPTGTDADGNMTEEALAVPKGTTIVADMVGIHYNPRTFPNPEVYRPSRWYDITSDDAFTAFSVGQRSCVPPPSLRPDPPYDSLTSPPESVCFLAHLLRDFEVQPLMEQGEVLESWKERILTNAVASLALQMADAPLILKRR